MDIDTAYDLLTSASKDINSRKNSAAEKKLRESIRIFEEVLPTTPSLEVAKAWLCTVLGEGCEDEGISIFKTINLDKLKQFTEPYYYHLLASVAWMYGRKKNYKEDIRLIDECWVHASETGQTVWDFVSKNNLYYTIHEKVQSVGQDEWTPEDTILFHLAEAHFTGLQRKKQNHLDTAVQCYQNNRDVRLPHFALHILGEFVDVKENDDAGIAAGGAMTSTYDIPLEKIKQRGGAGAPWLDRKIKKCEALLAKARVKQSEYLYHKALLVFAMINSALNPPENDAALEAFQKILRFYRKMLKDNDVYDDNHRNDMINEICVVLILTAALEKDMLNADEARAHIEECFSFNKGGKDIYAYNILADLSYQEGDYSKARDNALRVHELIEKARSGAACSRSNRGKQDLLEYALTSSRLDALTNRNFDMLIQCALHYGSSFYEALQYADKGKTSLLKKAMESPMPTETNLHERKHNRLWRLKGEQSRLLKHSYLEDLPAEADEKNTMRLIEIRDEIKKHEKKLLPAASRASLEESLILEDPLHSDGAIRTMIVEFYVSGNYTIVFLIKKTAGISLSAIRIDDLSRGKIRAIGRDWINNSRTFQSRCKSGPAPPDAAVDYSEAIRKNGILLGRCIMKHLLPKFRKHKIQHIVFIPHDALVHLPLHAAILEQGESPVYLFDLYQVSYAPSLAMLTRGTRGKNKRIDSFLIAKGPGVDPVEAEKEKTAMFSAFRGKKDYLSGRLRLEDLLRRVSGADAFHFIGHGVFDFETPLLSGLRIKDIENNDGKPRGSREARDAVYPMESMLNMGDIFSASEAFSRLSLVTLSSCMTGVVADQRVNEMIGLPVLFLYAGASTVVGAQWPVADEVSSRFMETFYKNLFGKKRAGITRTEAFHGAAKEIRDIYKDPVFWAPFQLVGNWLGAEEKEPKPPPRLIPISRESPSFRLSARNVLRSPDAFPWKKEVERPFGRTADDENASTLDWTLTLEEKLLEYEAKSDKTLDDVLDQFGTDDSLETQNIRKAYLWLFIRMMVIEKRSRNDLMVSRLAEHLGEGGKHPKAVERVVCPFCGEKTPVIVTPDPFPSLGGRSSKKYPCFFCRRMFTARWNHDGEKIINVRASPWF